MDFLPYQLRVSEEEMERKLSAIQAEMKELEEKVNVLMDLAKTKTMLLLKNHARFTQAGKETAAAQVQKWCEEAEAASKKKMELADEMKALYDEKISEFERVRELIEKKKKAEELEKQAQFEEEKAAEKKHENEKQKKLKKEKKQKNANGKKRGSQKK